MSCARANGLEPYAYFRYLFDELPKARTAEALEALLPWNVKPLLRVPQTDRSHYDGHSNGCQIGRGDTGNTT